MKVLLLGGTAFFGKDILRFFVEAGHQVTLFTRGNHAPSDLAKHQHIRGDRKVKADLERAQKEGPWDVVIDNIAFDAEDVKLALGAFSNTKHYLLCSTISVYRYVPENLNLFPIKESALSFDYQPKDEDLSNIHWKYARGKLEAERVVMTQKKIPWTIIRPPVVYGPNDVTDRGFWYLARILDGNPLLLANEGVNSFQIAYSQDIAKSFLQAVQSERAIGKAYTITQREVLTLRQFIEDNAKILGKKPEFVSAPLDLLGDLAGPHATMTNLIYDTDAAAKDLGFQPTAWPEFAELTAKWFVSEWKGDRAKLLETRKAELDFVKLWKQILLHAKLPTPTRS